MAGKEIEMKLFDEYSEYRKHKNRAKSLEAKIRDAVKNMSNEAIDYNLGKAQKRGLKMLVYWLENEKGNRID